MKNNLSDIPTIFVGYDPREKLAYEVLKYSALKYASSSLNIFPIKQDIMRRIGLYRRAWQLGSSILPKAKNTSDNQHRDIFDDKPFATDFSFSRFLVPFLNRLEGWALFMDCDMFFRSDPLEIFQSYNDTQYAVYCVKHNHQPDETVKMYGNEQYKYPRKNWSSLMLFNCSHSAHHDLTLDDINTKSGLWLHNLSWLKDSHIGMMAEEWNWLDGHSSVKINAKNVHFTRGGPWFKGHIWEPLNEKDKLYEEEWRDLSKEMKINHG